MIHLNIAMKHVKNVLIELIAKFVKMDIISKLMRDLK